MIAELKNVKVIQISYSEEGHEWPSEERPLKEVVDEVMNDPELDNYDKLQLIHDLVFNDERVITYEGEGRSKVTAKVKVAEKETVKKNV